MTNINRIKLNGMLSALDSECETIVRNIRDNLHGVNMTFGDFENTLANMESNIDMLRELKINREEITIFLNNEEQVAFEIKRP